MVYWSCGLLEFPTTPDVSNDRVCVIFSRKLKRVLLLLIG